MSVGGGGVISANYDKIFLGCSLVAHTVPTALARQNIFSVVEPLILKLNHSRRKFKRN